MNRWFIAGPKAAWSGRCEVVSPTHYIHHENWPILQTHTWVFDPYDTLPSLITGGYWEEIDILDPDLRLPEGI